ncbi:hypothetical protein AAHC03_019441 [Spirometra sp. Aus1]
MHLLLEARTKLTLLLVAAVIFYVIYENSRTASISSASISRHAVDEERPDILRLVQDEVNRIITDRRAGDEVSEEVGCKMTIQLFSSAFFAKLTSQGAD